MERYREWSVIHRRFSVTNFYIDTFPFNVLTLVNAASAIAPRLLPDLYEPVLAGFAINAFHIRGFERIEGPDGNYSVVQEWRCVKADKPYVVNGKPLAAAPPENK